MFTVADDVVTNISMAIAFGALTGLAVACQSLNLAIVGDIFVLEQQQRPMNIMELAPFLGVIETPNIGGYISAAVS
jgi:hypothetical protein